MRIFTRVLFYTLLIVSVFSMDKIYSADKQEAPNNNDTKIKNYYFAVTGQHRIFHNRAKYNYLPAGAAASIDINNTISEQYPGLGLEIGGDIDIGNDFLIGLNVFIDFPQKRLISHNVDQTRIAGSYNFGFDVLAKQSAGVGVKLAKKLNSNKTLAFLKVAYERKSLRAWIWESSAGQNNKAKSKGTNLNSPAISLSLGLDQKLGNTNFYLKGEGGVSLAARPLKFNADGLAAAAALNPTVKLKRLTETFLKLGLTYRFNINL